jgi:hypothetical protein
MIPAVPPAADSPVTPVAPSADLIAGLGSLGNRVIALLLFVAAFVSIGAALYGIALGAIGKKSHDTAVAENGRRWIVGGLICTFLTASIFTITRSIWNLGLG